MNEEVQVKLIKEELFRLAKEAPDLETIHWYIAVDECFENNEFQRSEANNLRWRLEVLYSMKKQPVRYLVDLIEPILKYYGFIDRENKWAEK